MFVFLIIKLIESCNNFWLLSYIDLNLAYLHSCPSSKRWFRFFSYLIRLLNFSFCWYKHRGIVSCWAGNCGENKEKKTTGSRLPSLSNTREVYFILTRGFLTVLCFGNCCCPISRFSAGGTSSSPSAFPYFKERCIKTKEKERTNRMLK